MIIHRSTRAECLAHLGARFRILLDLPDRVSDVEAGEVLLERYIMVHLKNNEEKFVLLMEMISKLYKLANDEISPDNPDSLNNHVRTFINQSSINQSINQSQIMNRKFCWVVIS